MVVALFLGWIVWKENMYDYYTVGFLYNKGYVDLIRGAVRIQYQDSNVLEYIKKIFGKGSIHDDILRIYDKDIAEKISYYRNLNIAAIPPEEFSNFVRGYFDAHGCVYIRQDKYAQITMTLQQNFVYSVQNILKCVVSYIINHSFPIIARSV